MQIGVWQQFPEDHIVVQVTAEDRRNKGERRAQHQRLGDVLLHLLGRRRCQRHAGDPRHVLAQAAQLEVVGPEVVTPLGDAVGLVHRQVGEQATGAQVHQAGLEGRRRHHLRGDVEQLQLGAGAAQVGQDETTLGRREFGVDGAGGDVEAPQAVHLVLGGDKDFRTDRGRFFSTCAETFRMTFDGRVFFFSDISFKRSYFTDCKAHLFTSCTHNIYGNLRIEIEIFFKNKN